MDTGGDQPLADEEIVRRVLAGEKNLFEVLVRRYQRKIVHYLFRMVPEMDLAEDLAQVSFIKAYTALATFDPKYRFTTWLYRIAANTAVDHHRRNRIRPVSLDQPLDTGDGELRLELPSSEPLPDELAGRRELGVILDRAVNRLPSAYRQLIVLRHGSDCSYEEIVEITGLPMGTVKNRLFRARTMLKTMLTESEGAAESSGGEGG